MEQHYNQNDSRQKKHDTEESYKAYEDLSAAIIPVPKDKLNEQNGKDKNGAKNRKKKLTKNERKALVKEQTEYERQLVKEGKIAPRNTYAPRNGFGHIVAVCVAFIIGFFAAVGTLIGGLAIFGSDKKIKDISQIAGFDYANVFTEYTADLSALDFVVEFVQKISKNELKSLGDVAVYTPLADKLTDTLVNQFTEMEIEVDKAELMAVPFSDLGTWLRENVFGNYADDYINTHTLGQVLTIDETSAPILQALKDTLLCDLGDAANTLKLSDMLGEEDLESNKILKNLKDSTLATLSEDANKLTVEQVFGDEMYCYLSLENGGKPYREMIDEYASTNRKTEAGSWLRPSAIEFQEGEEVRAEEEDGVTVYYLYRNGEKADKLDRYLDGTWYLLFGEDNDTSTPVLEMSANVLTVIDKVNTMYLWELWLHGIIKTNPYAEITYGEKTNLNEFNLSELIEYVQFLTQNS